ncbi:MAG: 3-deoxy-D-manno-octulosonic acid transferase [Desulfobacterales bacterium]
MKRHSLLKIALKCYDAGWRLFIPALFLSSRLRDGYEERRLASALPRAELWIQAASGGEAYLACSLIRELQPDRELRVLVTTNTRQGMDILEKARAGISADSSGITMLLGWCPFDRPAIMEKAVSRVNPTLTVLLETEIWPGLLYALKRRNRPAWIINGRITKKSFSGYRKIQPMMRQLRPEKIFAVSEAYAARFSDLFGKDIVSVMPNMKFDTLPSEKDSAGRDGRLQGILNKEAKFMILGSIRRQEEKQVRNIIKHVHLNHPDAIIGLFPRHMHRINHWKRELTKMAMAWQLRSKLHTTAEPGRVILWDKFGELSQAYPAADAVFIGGSLAPLGGQNFLEPLVHGCRAVIGPYWENFFWTGKEIFAKGLVIKESNWQSAAGQLVRQLENPGEKEEIRRKALCYITARQGGTKTSCRIIEKYLRTDFAKEAS